jgi:peptidoglycan pentaglycine glycine transferase (the first glycine)
VHARVADSDDRDVWNAHVARSDLADVLQSWEWGEIKKGTGWTPIRILTENGGLIATCSVLTTRPTRALPPLAYAPRGPVVNFQQPDHVDAVVSAIREECGDAFLFMCDPPVEEGSAGDLALSQRMNKVTTGGFGGVQPKTVMVLDLDPDLDKILEGFKSKWRYNIRLAERKGVEVREGRREDIGRFHDLLVETARRDGFSIRGRAYFESLWDHLSPSGKLKLFLAHYSDQLLSGIVLFCMGPRVVYVYGASSNEHRNVMPNHLIQWQAIRWSKENGFSVYDFRGVSPIRNGEPVDPNLAGLNRFKEGFGARYVEYAGQFDLPLRPAWYRLWRTAAPVAMRFSKRLKRTTD